MSKVRLTGATSGFTEITTPAVAGNNTVTLPSDNGAANQLLKNGATAGSLEFASNVVVDNSGRLLVGTSTVRAVTNGAETPRLMCEGTSNDRIIACINNVNDAGLAGKIVLGKSRGVALGSTTVVQIDDVIGVVEFDGADGTNLIAAASIRCEIDGTPGANDMPGRLVFSTTADGGSIATERMRIGSAGNVFIGQSTTAVPGLGNNTTGACINSSGTGFFSQTGVGLRVNRTADGAVAAFASGGTERGSISISGSTTTYNTSSDYRLKENVASLTGAIDRLQQIPVHRFNFIAHPGKTVDGFIAHEAAEVVPEAVTGTKDAVDADGTPVYQGIDQSKLVPLLTAALQEAIGKIDALESRIAALEVN